MKKKNICGIVLPAQNNNTLECNEHMKSDNVLYNSC